MSPAIYIWYLIIREALESLGIFPRSFLTMFFFFLYTCFFHLLFLLYSLNRKKKMQESFSGHFTTAPYQQRVVTVDGSQRHRWPWCSYELGAKRASPWPLTALRIRLWLPGQAHIASDAPGITLQDRHLLNNSSCCLFPRHFMKPRFQTALSGQGER